jgi:hypothetical protein
MEEHGSLASLAVLILTDWHNKQKLEQSKQFAGFSKGLAETLAEFERIGKTRDIDLIVSAERLTLTREQLLYSQNDKSILPSLNAANTDMIVIESSIGVVRQHEKYQAAAATYHPRKKAHGVVADGCHEAMNGHITRLGNRISAVSVSGPEKEILRRRQTNMRVAKELYITMQRAALDTALER